MKKENKKEIQEIRSSLKITMSLGSIQAIAIIRSNKIDSNKDIVISCEKGTCLTHKVVYDIIKDVIHTSCIDYYDLGIADVSYEMTTKDGFSIPIPLPENVLKKYLDDRRLSEFEDWSKKYPPESYEISYLQILHSY